MPEYNSILLLRSRNSFLLLRDRSGRVLLDNTFGEKPITSRAVLQDPVDYALAGEQRDTGPTRRGNATFAALRHIFRE